MDEYKLDYTAEEINERLSAALPVVELTTELTDEIVTLTGEEHAQLLAAANASSPIVCKLPNSGKVFVTVLSFIQGKDEYIYVGNIAVPGVTLSALISVLSDSALGAVTAVE